MTATRGHTLKVAVALGGGGARGYAHLGVLKTLVAHDVPIDIVCGTSMGALIGSAYACHLDLDKVVKLLERLDLHELLGVSPHPFTEMLERTASEYLFRKAQWREADGAKTQRLLEFYRLLTHNRTFESLDLPFAVVAADVDTGQEVVINRGNIGRALAASIALPGIHDPVRWQGRLLVDGGVVNKVPISVAVALGADVVVAVDVSGDVNKPVSTSLEVLAQANSITSSGLLCAQLELMQLKLRSQLILVCPAVDAIKTLALNEIKTPLEAGRVATEAALPAIERALEYCRLEQPLPPLVL